MMENVQENRNNNVIGRKIKEEIIRKIREEFEINYTEFINPIINYMIDQFNFEFKMYVIMAEIGLLIVIILFIINICFIIWLSKKHN